MRGKRLTQARLRSLLTYDPSTGGWRWRKSGRGRRRDLVAGSISRDGYLRICVLGQKILSARLAVFWMTGKWPRGDVDHIDTRRLNDRYKNLREATRSENSANARVRSTSSSRLKWAHFIKKTGRWRASIMVGGVHRHIGCFDSALKAHKAAWAVAREIYGEFARER